MTLGHLAIKEDMRTEEDTQEDLTIDEDTKEEEDHPEEDLRCEEKEVMRREEDLPDTSPTIILRAVAAAETQELNHR